MRLAFDIDGVVADFVSASDVWVKKTFGYDPVPHDCWDYFAHYPDGQMVARSLFTKGVQRDGIFLTPQPIPGAVDTLWRLWNDGHDIEFVTHRGGGEVGRADTRQWLDEHDLPWAVHFEKEKYVIPADFYLDDKPENVVDIIENGGDAYLFAQPWNTDVQDVLPTIRSWAGVDWLLSAVFDGEHA